MINQIYTRDIFYRAIDIIEDTYNITLLALFVYFAIVFAFYGFRIISVSVQLQIKICLHKLLIIKKQMYYIYML